jgi:phage shock protein A
MTKSVEAARAYVQAHDALASPEHVDDVAKLRDISNRVREREAKAKAAQEALFGAHADEVESGEADPADNTEAAAVINGYGHNYDSDVFEDFTPPARAD